MPQPGDEPPHTVVAGGTVAVVYHQVLVNPHRFQALLDLRQDLFPERLAFAAAVRGVESLPSRWARWAGSEIRRPQDRHQRHSRQAPAWIVERIPGGRVWLVLGLGPGQMLAHRLPIHPHKGGDFAVGVSGFMECKDRVDFGHRESLRHLRSPSAKGC